MFQPFSVNIPTIPEREFDLRAYGAGAIGDGHTSNTEAFRKAIEAAAAEGGKVIVPNGIWLTGPIRLLSNVELHLADNAVILFDKNPEEYPLIVTDFEGITRIRTKSPISAENAENIAINHQRKRPSVAPYQTIQDDCPAVERTARKIPLCHRIQRGGNLVPGPEYVRYRNHGRDLPRRL